jgi:ATP-dependent DNA helicase RecQ
LTLASGEIGQGETGNHDRSWVECSIARCLHALGSAAFAADRVALLRSLIRLRGGRIDLSELGKGLSEEEYALLKRFAIARTNSDLSLRLVDEDDESGLTGLSAALIFDPLPRNAYEPATPDGVLLRLTGHSRYRTMAQKA